MKTTKSVPPSSFISICKWSTALPSTLLVVVVYVPVADASAFPFATITPPSTLPFPDLEAPIAEVLDSDFDYGVPMRSKILSHYSVADLAPSPVILTMLCLPRTFSTNTVLPDLDGPYID